MDFLKNAANQFGSSANQQSQGQNVGSANAGDYPQQSAPSQGMTSQGMNQAEGLGRQQEQSGGGGGFLSGLQSKMNTAAGGGVESEKNEDYLDKGVDFVQERFLGQGPQNSESAIEQAKDEQISDYIRSQYKSATGSDIPIKDKETRFG